MPTGSSVQLFTALTQSVALPFDPSCDLCEAARLSEWHHEDDVCWVADCEVCGVPMVVWRQHGPTPPEGDIEHMLAQLTRVADARFGPGGWSVDRVMRQIPNHFHAHGRDPHWWSRRCDGGGSLRKPENSAPVGCPIVEVTPVEPADALLDPSHDPGGGRHGDAGGRLRRDELVRPPAPPGLRPRRAQPALPVVGTGRAARRACWRSTSPSPSSWWRCPTVKADFHTNLSVLAWVSTGPLLAFGVAAPFFGKVGDLFGHRRLYQFGLLGAMVSAVLTALAPDVGLLLFARALDGVQGAATGTASMAIILELFDREDRVKALGWWSLVGAGGPVLGVTLGSPVIQYFGWRTLFWGQLVLLVVASVVVAVLLPTSAAPEGGRRARAAERAGARASGRAWTGWAAGAWPAA